MSALCSQPKEAADGRSHQKEERYGAEHRVLGGGTPVVSVKTISFRLTEKLTGISAQTTVERKQLSSSTCSKDIPLRLTL